jgi:hypothetical protein
MARDGKWWDQRPQSFHRWGSCHPCLPSRITWRDNCPPLLTHTYAWLPHVYHESLNTKQRNGAPQTGLSALIVIGSVYSRSSIDICELITKECIGYYHLKVKFSIFNLCHVRGEIFSLLVTWNFFISSLHFCKTMLDPPSQGLSGLASWP